MPPTYIDTPFDYTPWSPADPRRGPALAQVMAIERDPADLASARTSSVSLELAHGGTIDLSNTPEAVEAREVAADDAAWTDGGSTGGSYDRERAEARAMADHPDWTR